MARFGIDKGGPRPGEAGTLREAFAATSAPPEVEEGDEIPDEADRRALGRIADDEIARDERGMPLAGTIEYARDAEILGAVWTGALIGLLSAAAGVTLGWILWG